MVNDHFLKEVAHEDRSKFPRNDKEWNPRIPYTSNECENHNFCPAFPFGSEPSAMHCVQLANGQVNMTKG